LAGNRSQAKKIYFNPRHLHACRALKRFSRRQPNSPPPQTVADNQWRINRIRSIEDGMLCMGHFEAAGDFDYSSPEIHSAMTAAEPSVTTQSLS
jgi:hypothetical protein